jgi:hypothetical protein
MSDSFSGGEKMTGFLEALSRSFGLNLVARVGFLKGSMAGWNGPRPVSRGGKKGSAAKGGQSPAAVVAMALEYGVPEKGIAPYPFFSRMIAKRKASWGPLLAQQLKQRQYNVMASLKVVGLVAKEQLQESIEEQTYEGSNFAGHQRTVDRKAGMDTPLRDSLNLIHAVDYVVVPEGEE